MSDRVPLKTFSDLVFHDWPLAQRGESYAILDFPNDLGVTVIQRKTPYDTTFSVRRTKNGVALTLGWEEGLTQEQVEELIQETQKQ